VVDAEGKAFSSTNLYKLDGKEYPYKTPDIDGVISVKRIDDFHAEATIKGGKVSISSNAVISKDGKTRIQTQTGADAQGRTVHNVVVTEKQ
jgi:hypothetical protein